MTVRARLVLTALGLVLALTIARVAAADEAPLPALPGATTSGPPAVAIVAVGGTRDDAFVLARALYTTRLRPRRLDEVRARVLAGQPVPEDATPDVKELGELRAAVVGEDAASRAVLASLAKRLGATALLVVVRDGDPSSGPVVARLFLAETGELDAARYAPVPGDNGVPTWRPTIASLERRFPAPNVPSSAATPPLPTGTAKTQPFLGEPRKAEASKPFYTSPWLWGSIGAAALLGGIFYVASRDTSADTIHLQVQLPR